MITCNEISTTIEYLKSKFTPCKVLNANDLQLLLDLILAVQNCATGTGEEGEHEGYTDSGDRDANLRAIMGDFDDSNHGTQVIVDDGNSQIILRSEDGVWLLSDLNPGFSTQLLSGELEANVRITFPTTNGTISLLSQSNDAPASSTSPGARGEVRIVGNTRYECIADNTWVSSTINTTF